MISKPVLIKNTFFNSLLVFGLVYLSFLFVFISQTFSGFIMQLIFLFNALSFHPENVLNLIISSSFLINFSSGLISLILLFLFVKSLFIIFNKIFVTRNYIKSLDIISQNKYFVFKSSIPHAFTAGLFNPQIFISSKLIKISSSKELKAIYLHEFFHKIAFDPFKDLYIDILTNTLPFLPFKSWFFGQYHLIKETCCDYYAQNLILDKKPLVSALIKIHSVYTPKLNLISHFSAQSERIKILTGKKTYHSFSPLSYSLFSVAFLILSLNFISRSNLFYRCQHLNKCLETFISGQIHSSTPCH